MERDLTPTEHATRIDGFKSRDGESVTTFVSTFWTFEFDLAAASWELASIIHQAVTCAKEAEKAVWPDSTKIAELRSSAKERIEELKAGSLAIAALEIYTPLKKKAASKAITAQFAAQFLSEPATILDATHFPSYVVSALKHLVGEP